MEVQKLANIVARCTRCRRGYVYVRRSGPMTCAYPPRVGYPVCGGKIEMLPEPIPNENEPPPRVNF